jgi:hypothetical protein
MLGDAYLVGNAIVVVLEPWFISVIDTHATPPSSSLCGSLIEVNDEQATPCERPIDARRSM